jgi:hypothetical protein
MPSPVAITATTAAVQAEKWSLCIGTAFQWGIVDPENWTAG